MTTQRPWIPIPSPIRRLFTSFPLHTFPPAPLPSSSPPPVDVPRLYIHTAPNDDPSAPSWDAECLKWQTFLRLAWAECIPVAGSSDSSPSGELPVLILPRSHEIVPLHKLHELVVARLAIPVNVRATAYLNLIDTKIHAAWVYAFYLAGDHDTTAASFLLPVPNGPEPLRYLVRRSCQLARRRELERRFPGEIRKDVVFSQAQEAYEALSAALGDDPYFFGEGYVPRGGSLADGRRLGLVDAAVFAYTWTVLERIRESELGRMVRRFGNLVQHASRVETLVYANR